MTSDIITRLSKLDAPDREVDGEIWRYLMSGEPRAVLHGPIPKLTASVDAAIALAKRIFGKVGYSVAETEDDEEARFAFIHINGEAYLGEGATPAIALLIALLRAKEASNDPR